MMALMATKQSTGECSLHGTCAQIDQPERGASEAGGGGYEKEVTMNTSAPVMVSPQYVLSMANRRVREEVLVPLHWCTYSLLESVECVSAMDKGVTSLNEGPNRLAKDNALSGSALDGDTVTLPIFPYPEFDQESLQRRIDDCIGDDGLHEQPRSGGWVSGLVRDCHMIPIKWDGGVKTYIGFLFESRLSNDKVVCFHAHFVRVGNESPPSHSHDTSAHRGAKRSKGADGSAGEKRDARAAAAELRAEWVVDHVTCTVMPQAEGGISQCTKAWFFDVSGPGAKRVIKVIEGWNSPYSHSSDEARLDSVPLDTARPITQYVMTGELHREFFKEVIMLRPTRCSTPISYASTSIRPTSPSPPPPSSATAFPHAPNKSPPPPRCARIGDGSAGAIVLCPARDEDGGNPNDDRDNDVQELRMKVRCDDSGTAYVYSRETKKFPRCGCWAPEVETMTYNRAGDGDGVVMGMLTFTNHFAGREKFTVVYTGGERRGEEVVARVRGVMWDGYSMRTPYLSLQTYDGLLPPAPHGTAGCGGDGSDKFTNQNRIVSELITRQYPGRATPQKYRRIFFYDDRKDQFREDVHRSITDTMMRFSGLRKDKSNQSHVYSWPIGDIATDYSTAPVLPPRVMQCKSFCVTLPDEVACVTTTADAATFSRCDAKAAMEQKRKQRGQWQQFSEDDDAVATVSPRAFHLAYSDAESDHAHGEVPRHHHRHHHCTEPKPETSKGAYDMEESQWYFAEVRQGDAEPEVGKVKWDTDRFEDDVGEVLLFKELSPGRAALRKRVNHIKNETTYVSTCTTVPAPDKEDVVIAEYTRWLEEKLRHGIRNISNYAPVVRSRAVAATTRSMMEDGNDDAACPWQGATRLRQMMSEVEVWYLPELMLKFCSPANYCILWGRDAGDASPAVRSTPRGARLVSEIETPYMRQLHHHHHHGRNRDADAVTKLELRELFSVKKEKRTLLVFASEYIEGYIKFAPVASSTSAPTVPVWHQFVYLQDCPVSNRKKGLQIEGTFKRCEAHGGWLISETTVSLLSSVSTPPQAPSDVYGRGDWHEMSSEIKRGFADKEHPILRLLESMTPCTSGSCSGDTDGDMLLHHHHHPVTPSSSPSPSTSPLSSPGGENGATKHLSKRAAQRAKDRQAKHSERAVWKEMVYAVMCTSYDRPLPPDIEASDRVAERHFRQKRGLPQMARAVNLLRGVTRTWRRRRDAMQTAVTHANRKEACLATCAVWHLKKHAMHRGCMAVCLVRMRAWQQQQQQQVGDRHHHCHHQTETVAVAKAVAEAAALRTEVEELRAKLLCLNEDVEAQQRWRRWMEDELARADSDQNYLRRENTEMRRQLEEYMERSRKDAGLIDRMHGESLDQCDPAELDTLHGVVTKTAEKIKREQYQREVQAMRDQIESTMRESAMECKNAATECKICMVNPVQIVLLPCGHLAVCSDCAKRMNIEKGDKPCPICRNTVTDTVKAVLS